MTQITESNKDLNPTTDIITISDLGDYFAVREERLKNNRNYSKNGWELGRTVLNLLSDISQKDIVTVKLLVPKKFHESLVKGEVIRVGGVLRQAKDQRIAHHMKEIRPTNVSKLTKVANLAFFAIDILESILVDKKLNEILTEVKDINLKIDAQMYGNLQSALQGINELNLCMKDEFRLPKIPLIDKSLRDCECQFNNIYKKKWEKVTELDKEYYSSKIRKRSVLKKQIALCNSLPSLFQLIVTCKVARIKLCELQGDYTLANRISVELSEFLAKSLLEFKQIFGNEAIQKKLSEYKILKTEFFKPKLEEVTDQVKESNEVLEYLLQSALCYTLFLPEVVGDPSEAPKNGFDTTDAILANPSRFDRFKKKLHSLFHKIVEILKSLRGKIGSLW